MEGSENVNVKSHHLPDELDVVEQKIMEIITVYPRISPTMLQAGLGPSLSPELWRPALEKLIRRNLVSQTAEFPPAGSKRTRPFAVIELVEVDIKDVKVPPRPAAHASAA
jgi:hypothetical protein